MPVKINLEKAKGIQRNRWRKAREPLLAALDVEFRKAHGNPQKQNEVEAKAQVLRDVTLTDLSHVTTPEELKDVWPAVLGPKP